MEKTKKRICRHVVMKWKATVCEKNNSDDVFEDQPEYNKKKPLIQQASSSSVLSSASSSSRRFVQAGGHRNSIHLDEDCDNTILKKHDPNEEEFYKIFSTDMFLSPFIAKCYGERVDQNGQSWISLQDLTNNYINAQIADIKIGRYTYYPDEKGLTSKQRPDLYQKLIKQDPLEPTDQENQSKSITKKRYLDYRDTSSTTREFGYRFEGLQVKGESIDVKRVCAILNHTLKIFYGTF